VFGACQQRHVVYSRYADDLFLSTNEPNRLSDLLEMIRTKLAEGGRPVLRINENKTVFTSRKRKRIVTGLVLTSDRQLSVGRKKKRQIRSMIHLYRSNGPADAEVSYLRGYLAFVNSVEPEFLDRLKRKYGDELLGQIMGEEVVARK
jgi:RNA-directed DNA polymerase